MIEIQLKERLYFIGDIHAQYNKLTDLLKVINFDTNDSNSMSAGGQLVFIGDLIDSVPKNDGDHLALLNKVKSLVENNHAFCLLGNHEFNAVGWATQKENGEWARPHSDNNRKQHNAFLEAVEEGSMEHKRWISWFKSLPLFIDFGTVKAIHACWDEDVIEQIKPYLNANNSLKEIHWVDAFDKTHELFNLCETLLKGPERKADKPFTDKTGKVRTQKRIEWWADSEYKEPIVPIVIGHYTLNCLPKVLSNKVVCVDYNAAKGDNPLVCCKFELMSTDRSFIISEIPFYSSHKLLVI
ncbi:metallophosphoesterase [Psychromonas sp. SP041]|uniref:metallophosphoesterase n=1 Tax=Psychromonas sp. SP041 TaxID=1365007 RepID=UPI0003F97C25|nr:metallophosphoesterase [Psychromonas sp. SP041]